MGERGAGSKEHGARSTEQGAGSRAATRKIGTPGSALVPVLADGDPSFGTCTSIDLGSAAETECLLRTADEVGYLPKADVQQMADLLDEILALLFTLVRRTTRTAAQPRA